MVELPGMNIQFNNTIFTFGIFPDANTGYAVGDSGVILKQ